MGTFLLAFLCPHPAEEHVQEEQPDDEAEEQERDVQGLWQVPKMRGCTNHAGSEVIQHQIQRPLS